MPTDRDAPTSGPQLGGINTQIQDQSSLDGRLGISGSVGGCAAWQERALQVEAPRWETLVARLGGLHREQGAVRVWRWVWRLRAPAQPVFDPLQAQARHAMQFPAELTRDACRTHTRELRLICIYFFTSHFFKVSAMVSSAGWVLASPWGLQGSMSPPGLSAGTNLLCTLSQPEPLSGPLF